MILDSIFENKVGFGKAQAISLVFLSLIDLNDGAQLVLSTSFLTIRLLPHSNHKNSMEFDRYSSLFLGFHFLHRHFLWFCFKWEAIGLVWKEANNQDWINNANFD